MDATRDYHSKYSKSERERQIPYDIIFMWNLKYGNLGFVDEKLHLESSTTRSYCIPQGTIANLG